MNNDSTRRSKRYSRERAASRSIENRQVIVEWQMVNKQTGHSTEFFIDDIRTRKELPDADFTPTALQHG